MEREKQRKINYLEFFQENYLVPVKYTQEKKETSTEERLLKLFFNLVNLYKALYKLRNYSEEVGYIIQSLKPVLKILNNNVRKNNFVSVDLDSVPLDKIVEKIKGLSASINIGLETLSSFYSQTDNDRMNKILSKALNAFSTTYALIEKFKI